MNKILPHTVDTNISSIGHFINRGSKHFSQDIKLAVKYTSQIGHSIYWAGDDGLVRVRWSCVQGGGSGVEYIVVKQVTLAETLCY